MTDDVLKTLEPNEKQTIINALKHVSTGMDIDRIEELNHLSAISNKIKESLKVPAKSE